MKKNNCDECGIEFESIRKKRFCGRVCSGKFYQRNVKKHEKKCKVCGKAFKTRNKQTMHCSPVCTGITNSKKIDRVRQYQKECRNCNKSFVANSPATLYCKDECREEKKSNSTIEKIRKCLFCKKEFENLNGRHFCSKYCRRQDEYRKRKVFTKQCIVCDKEFKTKRQATKTCSRSCANHTWVGKYKKERVVLCCKNCNESFEAQQSNYENRKFCSHSCASAWQMKTRGIQSQKGEHFSSKTRVTYHYNSSWEKKVMENFDKNDKVVSYMYEPFSQKYKTEKKTRNYLPDFLVYRIDGIMVVEIKPKRYQEKENIKRKFKVAKEYCKQNNLKFEVWTEDDYEKKSMI